MSRFPKGLLSQASRWQASLPPATEKAWSGLKQREKNVVLLGVAVLATALLWKAAWLPSQAYLSEARQRYAHNAIVETWLARHASEPAAFHPAAPESLSSVITDTAQAEGIGISALTARSANQLEVRSAPVSFPSAIGWLYSLEAAHHIHVFDLELMRTGSEGMVTVRLTAGRAGGS